MVEVLEEMSDKEKDAPKARPGISPLDLLLDQMREAWEDARRHRAEGNALKEEAFSLPAGDPQRRITLEAAGEKLMAAFADEKRARELAKDAAPYQHAKLSNTQAHLTGDVTITRRSF